MVKNHHVLEAFERELQQSSKLTLSERLNIFESLYKHARSLGHFSERDKLSGLEDTVELAHRLNIDASKASR
jgi:hypothetical protein